MDCKRRKKQADLSSGTKVQFSQALTQQEQIGLCPVTHRRPHGPVLCHSDILYLWPIGKQDKRLEIFPHPWKLFIMQFPIQVVVLHARAWLKSFMAGQLTQRPFWYVPPHEMLDTGISSSHSFKPARRAALSKAGSCNSYGAFLWQARNYKLKLLYRDTFSRFNFFNHFCPYSENKLCSTEECHTGFEHTIQ